MSKYVKWKFQKKCKVNCDSQWVNGQIKVIINSFCKSTKPYSDKPVSDNLNYLGALNLKNDFSLHHYEMNVAIVTSC